MLLIYQMICKWFEIVFFLFIIIPIVIQQAVVVYTEVFAHPPHQQMRAKTKISNLRKFIMLGACSDGAVYSMAIWDTIVLSTYII